MIRKIYHVLAVPSLVVTLAVAGLLGTLGATGRLTRENLERIVAVLRGEQAVAAVATTQSTAATQPTAATAEQLTVNETAAELTNLLIDRRSQELLAQQRQLESLRGQVAGEREQLRLARLKLQDEILADRQREQDTGFKKLLKLCETMQPRLVKDVLMEMEEAEAAGYLQRMSTQKAAKVIDQFRTSTEKARLQRLLDVMKMARG